MSYIGHPVVGDPVYGTAQKLDGTQLNGQLLHAKTLTLEQPTTGDELSFDSPLPDYFQFALSILTPINREEDEYAK